MLSPAVVVSTFDVHLRVGGRWVNLLRAMFRSESSSCDGDDFGQSVYLQVPMIRAGGTVLRAMPCDARILVNGCSGRVLDLNPARLTPISINAHGCSQYPRERTRLD